MRIIQAKNEIGQIMECKEGGIKVLKGKDFKARTRKE